MALSTKAVADETMTGFETLVSGANGSGVPVSPVGVSSSDVVTLVDSSMFVSNAISMHALESVANKMATTIKEVNLRYTVPLARKVSDSDGFCGHGLTPDKEVAISKLCSQF
jgi:hypothetical protein